MRTHILAAIALVGGFAASPALAATTINFDGSTTTSEYAAQGAVFSGFTVGSNTFDGAIVVPSSPNYASLDVGGGSIRFIDALGAATTSNGFGLTVAGLTSGGGFFAGATLTFLGLSNAVLGTQSFAPVGPDASRSPIEFSTALTGISSVRFDRIENPRGLGGFVIDDVTFDLQAVQAPVPEPATWAMMLVGFGMIGATARYRRRKTRIAYA